MPTESFEMTYARGHSRLLLFTCKTLVFPFLKKKLLEKMMEERDKGKRKGRTHTLAYSSSDHSRQVWARTKPRARNNSPASLLGSRGPSTHPLLPDQSAGSWMGSSVLIWRWVL